MTNLTEIKSDPDWIPHELDQHNGQVSFVKIDRETTESHGFLADVADIQTEALVPVEEVVSLELKPSPIRYIFHSGFCRSTLLLRSVQYRGRSVCLNEPEILNSLARVKSPDQRLVDAIMGLLARQRLPGETVIVKPSNFPNRLIPQFMQVSPHSRGLIITNRLPEFLSAIVRKGLHGRQWGRQVYMAVSAYGGKVDQYHHLIPSMTDLQVAGLGWLLSQNWFETLVSGHHAKRLATLHSDVFDQRREDTVAKAAEHLGLDFSTDDISSIVDGPVFQQDAKVGGDYAAKAARDRARSHSAVVEEEIAAVANWVNEIARVSGLKVPVPQSLY